MIEGSVSTTATSFDLADGVLTFYFAPNQDPGTITYDVYGYLPGQYRALPASIKSAYEPGRFHLGAASDLRVRPAGEPGTDPYKPTPTSSTPAARPTLTPAGFPSLAMPSSPSSAATPSATISPRMRPACSS